MKSLSRLAVNWHFINACNMSCGYCFADKAPRPNRSPKDVLRVIDKLSVFQRINFVGGEPTLSPLFPQMAAHAHSLGLETSAITNGFFALQNPRLFDVFRPMATVGLSIDSLSSKSNLEIGRHACGAALSKKEALYFCKRIRDMGIELKINTVVNRYNLEEDFSEFLIQAQPSRWKVFQVLTGHSPQAGHFRVSDTEFQAFIKRHSAFDPLIRSESSILMQNSYIMLNAEGYFMGTAPYELRPCQKTLFQEDADALEEFQKINYDLQKYAARYKK